MSAYATDKTIQRYELNIKKAQEWLRPEVPKPRDGRLNQQKPAQLSLTLRSNKSSRCLS